MKRSLLSRLRINGWSYLTSAVLLLLIIPVYQLLVLNPLDYGKALNTAGTGRSASYLIWISQHTPQFLVYRLLLLAAFALILTLPFSLYRIIVAQELLGQQESAETETNQEPELDNEAGQAENTEATESADGLPPYAWRGKGFAVLATWAGIIGLCFYLLGTIASTIYLLPISNGFTTATPLPAGFSTLSSIFTITANTVGIGFLAVATLFFGAMIARSGKRLWPTSWVLFSYLALAVTALLSGSAVAVASAPGEGQAALTSPAILLFALWVLWLGIMLVRLQPDTQEQPA